MPVSYFDIIPPYDFELSLKFSQRSRFEIVDQTDNNILRRLLNAGNSTVLAEISCNGGVEASSGQIKWDCIDGKRPDERTIIEIASHMLSASLNLTPFYNLADKSKNMRELTKKFRGLKPILTPTIFESAAWAIMGQQVNLNFAHILKKRLVENFGKKFRINGEDFYIFPKPGNLSKVTVADLRELQFSSRKAEYLLGISAIMQNDGSGLKSLSKQNYNEAIDRLIDIRGIGVWSANYILMRGAGHIDCLPLGDSGLHRAIKILNRLKELPDNAKVEKSARKFIPYRSLYTLYLWFLLMEGASVK